MIITTDDVCPENLKYWHYWDEIKKNNPQLKVLAFVIANYKYEQDISKSEEFISWYKRRIEWVVVGIHGYDHSPDLPPEQERSNAEELVKKSLDILKPFLPDRVIYRPPGFQRTIYTEPMLKRLGVFGIAYQTKIKWLDTKEVIGNIFNSHCCNRFFNPVTKLSELGIFKERRRGQ